MRMACAGSARSIARPDTGSRAFLVFLRPVRWPFFHGGKTMPNTSIKHWQDPLNLILGIWMIVSPWALRYQTDMTLNAVMSNAATSNAVILGILIAAAALVALFRVMAWEEWVNVVLGV